MRKIVVIALMLALGLMLVPSLTTAWIGVYVVGKTGDGTWVGSTWKVDIYPGEEKSTTLTLYNPTVLPVSVEVAVAPESLDNGNLTFELSQSGFVLPKKAHAAVVLTVKASGNATPGTYTAELRIKSEVATQPPAPPGPGPVVTPSPTPTVSPTVTPTPSPTVSPTPTPTPVSTVTPTPTPTPTETPPPAPAEEVTPWWIIGVVAAVALVLWFTWRRRRKHASRQQG